MTAHDDLLRVAGAGGRRGFFDRMKNSQSGPRDDDSILVVTAVHPAVPGAPRPETGRPRGAGLLAQRVSAFVRLPEVALSGMLDDRSPLTVAGAAADCLPRSRNLARI